MDILVYTPCTTHTDRVPPSLLYRRVLPDRVGQSPPAAACWPDLESRAAHLSSRDSWDTWYRHRTNDSDRCCCTSPLPMRSHEKHKQNQNQTTFQRRSADRGAHSRQTSRAQDS